MKRWKNFLRNRKRSDRVKIMLYLGIAAAVFLVMTAVDIVNLVKALNTPAEYILSGDTVSDARLNQLMEIDGVGAVTPVINNSLTVKYRTNETYIGVSCISKEYAKAVYGAERTGEMTTLFANSVAYRRILSELAGAGSVPDLNNEIMVEVRDGDRYKACRIVCFHQENSAEEAFVFMVMADSALRTHADSVRAFVPRQDTEQLAVSRMQSLGYMVMNREEILSFRNRIDLLFIEMKYHLIIAAMCCLWIATLRRFASDKINMSGNLNRASEINNVLKK